MFCFSEGLRSQLTIDWMTFFFFCIKIAQKFPVAVNGGNFNMILMGKNCIQSVVN